MPSHRNPIDGVYCTAAPTHMGIRAQGNIVEGWECNIYWGCETANAVAGWMWGWGLAWRRDHYWVKGYDHFTGSMSKVPALKQNVVLLQCSLQEARDWPWLQCSSNRLDLSSMPEQETDVLLSLVSTAAPHLHSNCNSVQLCAALCNCAIMQNTTNDPPAPGYCWTRV